MDSCLNYIAYEVTFPTHNCEVFWLQHVRASIFMENEWPSHEQLRSVGSSSFSCGAFAPVPLRVFFTCCTTIFFKNICHKLRTSFMCLCSRSCWSRVIVYVHKPPQKRLAERETILQSTVNSPQTSLKAPWSSVGFLPRKVSILMHNL